MKLFSTEMLFLNILQEHCKRSDDAFWDIERYKNAFEKASLQTMLSNKRYIGTNFYGKEEYPNTIPAIIEENLFNRVQEVKQTFKHAPARGKAKEEYILTTKLFCRSL